MDMDNVSKRNHEKKEKNVVPPYCLDCFTNVSIRSAIVLTSYLKIAQTTYLHMYILLRRVFGHGHNFSVNGYGLRKYPTMVI